VKREEKSKFITFDGDFEEEELLTFLWKHLKIKVRESDL
jgi:hypothetical protein